MLLKNEKFVEVSMDFVCGQTFVICMTEVCPRTKQVTIWLKEPDK